jgi:hypothetical protein
MCVERRQVLVGLSESLDGRSEVFTERWQLVIGSQEWPIGLQKSLIRRAEVFDGYRQVSVERQELFLRR